jgi:hypothetical protein
MSNYHVLDVNDKEDKINVAFHIVVPDELNAVGVNLMECVSQFIDQTTKVPWLEVDFPTEYIQIGNGEVYEYSITVQVDANLSVLDKRTLLDNRFNTLNTAIPEVLRKRFKFWGLNRDV